MEWNGMKQIHREMYFTVESMNLIPNYHQLKHITLIPNIKIGGGRVLPQADSGLTSSVAYHKNITQYLYRNSLFARLNLPHRYTALIHVDILGLKEVGGGN